jgi:hypothetical protein
MHRANFARIQAMYLFSLSVGGWMLLMETAYLRMIRHSWFTSKPIATIFSTVYLLTAFIFNHIFIVNERDRKIFGKYEEEWDRNPNKKRPDDFSLCDHCPLFIPGIPFHIFPRHS